MINKVKTETLSYIVTFGIAYLLFGVGFGWFKTDLNLLRWYVSIWCLFLAVQTFVGKNFAWSSLFTIILVVFNPLFRVFNYTKSTWQMFDVVTAILLVIFVVNYYRRYAKGLRFEIYTSRLFPTDKWVIADRTKDTSKKLGRLVESDMHPDFVFRHIATNKKLAVECKFRSYFIRGKYGDQGIWWKKEQGERYKKYGETTNIPVYVSLGIGGTPSKPNRVFLCPLYIFNTAPYGFVTEKMLTPFENFGNKQILNFPM
ncbi:MAG: hypothetical protein NT098_06005 [Candidatus Parcubacteria bacterium]|nr:hypothetical protein [Candidatus Parcubacteria bacterium]